MPQVYAGKAINKLKNIEMAIRKGSIDALEHVAQVIQKSIYTGMAKSYVPEWSAAKDWHGNTYMELHKGLLNIIKETPISFTGDVSENATMINVGIGHIPTLDRLTMSEGGVGKNAGRAFPYWRLFEYGSSRSKGSSVYTFFTPQRSNGKGGLVPSTKYGQRGQGYSILGKPDANARARRLDPFGRPDGSGKVKKAGTRGVLPVHMFSGTLRAYGKDRIRKDIKDRIKAELEPYKE